MHVHHFLLDKYLLSTIFDQISTARMSVLNELVAVFDVQSDRGDHLGGVDSIFQRKRQLQGRIMFGVVVSLLQSEARQCEYLVVRRGWFESLDFGSIVMRQDLFGHTRGPHWSCILKNAAYICNVHCT